MANKRFMRGSSEGVSTGDFPALEFSPTVTTVPSGRSTCAVAEETDWSFDGPSNILSGGPGQFPGAAVVSPVYSRTNLNRNQTPGLAEHQGSALQKHTVAVVSYCLAFLYPWKNKQDTLLEGVRPELPPKPFTTI